MNFRVTTLFFGLLLTTLWIFGLMISHKKAALDQSAIMPTMQSPDVKIDKIVVTKTNDKGSDQPTLFVRIGERWYLKEGSQQARVESFRVDEIIRGIKDAKQEEAADVSEDLSHYGLKSPSVVVTLSGKDKDTPKEWDFKIGKESADKAFYYVNSSDRPDKTFAVGKRSIEPLFMKDGPNALRSKRVLDFTESSVTDVAIQKEGKDLELKRSQNNLWAFVKPPLGFAGFDAPAEDKKPDEKFAPKKEPELISGVKGLLDSILKVRVTDDDDFIPLGKSLVQYDLEGDKAPMRVAVTTSGGEGKKESTTDTLLVGRKVQNPKGEFYYARLASDDGVMRIASRQFEPIEKALRNPGKIRSLDIAVFDPNKVDAIVLTQGKDELKFTKPEKDPQWQMFVGSEKKKANDNAVRALLEQVLGKKAIVDFDDVSETELKKRETEWGLDAPGAIQIVVYEGALEKEKKDSKDESKDEKEKKDSKDKKSDDSSTVPGLKKDAKPIVTLVVGKADNDAVHVRRTLADGTVSRMILKKEWLDKLIGPQGLVLTYLDTSLPGISVGDVTSLSLSRTNAKGPEKLELEARKVGDKTSWYIKDPLEPTGFKLADSNRVERIINGLAQMQAKEWVKKLDSKEDLEKYGLKNPIVEATLRVKKNELSQGAAASILGLLGVTDNPLLFAAAAAFVDRQADKGEAVTFQFGKETNHEKDKPADFAKRSGVDTLFLVPAEVVQFLKEEDVRDRSFMLNAQAEMIVSSVGAALGDPTGLLMLLSPHISGKVQHLDADKVKEIRLAVRTPYELRTFAFARSAKDKTAWTDASSLQDFQVDSAKVASLVKDLSDLHTSRFVAFVGGPRGEHKLGSNEANLKIDLVMDGGNIVTLTVGTKFPNQGYFAHSSLWPEVVFFLPAATIDPLRAGVSYFGKEHVGVN